MRDSSLSFWSVSFAADGKVRKEGGGLTMAWSTCHAEGRCCIIAEPMVIWIRVC
jgi:hypothetical protein